MLVVLVFDLHSSFMLYSVVYFQYVLNPIIFVYAGSCLSLQSLYLFQELTYWTYSVFVVSNILVSSAIYMTLCTRLLHDDPMKSSMHAIEGDTSLDRPSCNGRSDYSLCVQKFHIFYLQAYKANKNEGTTFTYVNVLQLV